MMTKLFLFISVLFIAFGVRASGYMELSGTISGFNVDQVEISDGQNIYSIEKKFLPPEVAKGKVGMKMNSTQIPFTAIKSVHKVSKK